MSGVLCLISLTRRFFFYVAPLPETIFLLVPKLLLENGVLEATASRRTTKQELAR